MIGKIFKVVSRGFSGEVAGNSRVAKDVIEEILGKSKVVLFMKGTPESPQCGFSRLVVNVLRHYKVKDFYHFNILEDTFIREELKKYSEWPTYPQLYINKELIGGADILRDMHLNDTLKELLEKNQVI